MVFHHGAALLGLFETWTLESIMPDLLKRKYGNGPILNDSLAKMAAFYNDIERWNRHMPINECTSKRFGQLFLLFEQLNRSLHDPNWEKASLLNKYDDLTIPAYHLGGWYDALLDSTIENYTNMNAAAGPNSQKLIIGAWGHGNFSSTIGERFYGIHSSGDWINLNENLTDLHIRWFDYWLKGMKNNIMTEAPVTLFVMGTNEWRDEQEWPLARTTYVPYYFHSDGHANTGEGDGILNVTIPGHEQTDQFTYDPLDPVPTNGGSVLYAGVNTEGPHDQRLIEKRNDVLVYTSEPLVKPMEVTGPVKVILWAATDAVDTDFTAKLVDVLPDGTAYNLTDGIVRAKYRHGFTPEPKLNGEIVPYEISLSSTSNVFLQGHRIRVEVSSSNFPRFDVNLNTGRTMINSSDTKIATQTIYHDAEHPSHIVLPMIP